MHESGFPAGEALEERPPELDFGVSGLHRPVGDFRPLVKRSIPSIPILGSAARNAASLSEYPGRTAS